jgi:hypothetical protein
MSTEYEPIVQAQPLDDRLIVDDTLNDPEFRAILDEFDAQVAELSDDIDALPALLELPGPEIPPVTQESVDEIAESLLGCELSDVEVLVKDLDETNKTNKKVVNGSILESGIINIGLDRENPLPSRQAQRRVSRHRSKVQELVNFWQSGAEQQPTSRLTTGRIGEIRSTLIDPVENILGKFSPEARGDKTSYITELKRRLGSEGQIDERIDLSALKFAVIANIARILHDPEIRSLYARAMQQARDVESMTEFTGVIRSDLGGSLMTAEFLRHMRTDPAEISETRSIIASQHRDARLFSIPKRSFMAKIDQLKEHTDIYVALLEVETLIEGSQGSFEDMSTNIGYATELEATRVGYKIAGLLNATYNKIALRSNELIKESTDDKSARDAVWLTAATLDEYRIAMGRQLMDRLQSSGLSFTDTVLGELRTELTPRIETQMSKLNERHELELLHSEIEQRAEVFESIDGKYEITGKSLRKLRPEAITLAKHLSDSLPNEVGPLDYESARAVVALMLGVHHIKKDGYQVDVRQIVSDYLSDATSLQNITQELAFLGHAKESTLLTTINLLNELIDAGTFDNPAHRNELAIFDEFLLEYMDAATRPPQAEDNPEILETDTTAPLPLPEVPIKTLRQAEFEELKVFPPGATDTEIMEDYVRGIAESELPQIEWERITRLVQLRDQLAKQSMDVSLIRTQHASWQVLPFFVLEAKLSDTSMSTVIVESPVYGNATYIYRESSQRQPWRQVIEQSRLEARKAGAVALVHVDSKRLDNHFKKVWDRLISELTIYQ